MKFVLSENTVPDVQIPKLFIINEMGIILLKSDNNIDTFANNYSTHFYNLQKANFGFFLGTLARGK